MFITRKVKGTKLKNIVEGFKNWLLVNEYHRSCALFVTIVSSIVSRRAVKVSYDGLDWIHSWATGSLVTSRPAFNAPTHTSASLSLFTYGYQPVAGDVVLDIGAGVGTEVKAFSDWVGPHGRVFAVEADPEAFRRLEKLIRLLKLSNVKALNFAVGDSEGVALLTQDGADGLVNQIVENSELLTVSVPMVTLDSLTVDLGLERIDYLKMNIEGAERLALIGFENRSPAVRNWCISCHDFLGLPDTATSEFVENWFRERGISSGRHPTVAGSDWMEFYIYASGGTGD